MLPKTEICMVDALSLRRGDMILMEAHIRKWFDDARYGRQSQQGSARNHGITYQLQAISLLERGSASDLGEWSNTEDGVIT